MRVFAPFRDPSREVRQAVSSRLGERVLGMFAADLGGGGAPGWRWLDPGRGFVRAVARVGPPRGAVGFSPKGLWGENGCPVGAALSGAGAPELFPSSGCSEGDWFFELGSVGCWHGG